MTMQYKNYSIPLANYFHKFSRRSLHINRSEFSNLTSCLESVTDVYIARPYASYERGSNEKHNGLLRRYIPKRKAISDYSRDTIQHIYQTLNNLPRRILNYQQPAVAFEQELAKLS